MSAYRRDFDKTKCVSFSIKDEKLLEKYNEIWKKFSNVMKDEFDSKPACSEKYLKTKTKFYNGKISTNYHNDKYQKKALFPFFY